MPDSPDNSALLRELARVKALFQLRTIATVMGFDPQIAPQIALNLSRPKPVPDIIGGARFQHRPWNDDGSLTGRAGDVVIVDDPDGDS